MFFNEMHTLVTTKVSVPVVIKINIFTINICTIDVNFRIGLACDIGVVVKNYSNVFAGPPVGLIVANKYVRNILEVKKIGKMLFMLDRLG